MEFRRIEGLPPYVFAEINELKTRLRRQGEDVVDLGFGNPDLPSPEVVVDKLAEAAYNVKNHRYSSSRGLPRLRRAFADLYRERFSVELDPEREVVMTIGAKEGLSHLMWVLTQPGDVALVPSPSYPIHLFAPVFAGAAIATVPMGLGDGSPVERICARFEESRPRPRVIVASFPHNPTAEVVELHELQRLVDFAREHDVLVIHDFAYADLGFDGYEPPSILACEGAKEVCVELYSLTKSYSMAGWRMACLVGNERVVQALTKLKSYLDYGVFQPIQIASIIALTEARDYPKELRAVYQSRRDVLVEGLGRIGWEVPRPRATMFVWTRIPAPYRSMGSRDFARLLVEEAKVAVSPGEGFGPGGEEFVRFALVENEERIRQAVRGVRRALPELRVSLAKPEGRAPRGTSRPGRSGAHAARG